MSRPQGDFNRMPYGGAPPQQPPRGGGGGGHVGPSDGRSTQRGYGDKPRARAVPLRVEKVTDKSLQSRLIYGNM